jgi:hypothetical protein
MSFALKAVSHGREAMMRDFYFTLRVFAALR